jgi:hypothetical protein
MIKHVMTFGVALAAAGTLVAAQGTTPQNPTPQGTAQAAPPRIASPAGSSQTQIGGTTGKWIEITYGRPIKRGRDVWGSGPTYAQLLLVNGAKVWRAGANVSTRLKTEVPLQIGGKTVPAGEYSLFIDTKSPTDWTLIVSSWGAKSRGGDQTPDTLWGSFGYTADKDVARVAMKMDKLPVAIDQLTWNFADVTEAGGKLVLLWDTVAASASFTVAK